MTVKTRFQRWMCLDCRNKFMTITSPNRCEGCGSKRLEFLEEVYD